jgi:hypothetical protein
MRAVYFILMEQSPAYSSHSEVTGDRQVMSCSFPWLLQATMQVAAACTLAWLESYSQPLPLFQWLKK